MTPRIPLAVPVNERDHRQGPASAAVTLVQYGDGFCHRSRFRYCSITVSNNCDTRKRTNNIRVSQYWDIVILQYYDIEILEYWLILSSRIGISKFVLLSSLTSRGIVNGKIQILTYYL
jgi:hypothetical protein